jgi:amidohydrolase
MCLTVAANIQPTGIAMPTVNRFADFHDEITAWRRDLHENPEILYDVHRTAAAVEEKLRSFGVDEVVTGMGRTGVVGIIRGRSDTRNKVIGLRADMDALNIREQTGKPYASRTEGKMHACGHDGHTAMLLGAARYLAETRNFDGTVAVIFQPAEEGGAGALAMVRDGLMDRWNIQEVYGMHNLPGLPAGEISMRAGAVMASTDEFKITISGVGGHAAIPQQTVDPIVAAAALVQALQSIASRNVDPVSSVVVSVTTIKAGNALNVIPDSAEIAGTIRTLDASVRDLAEKRLKEIARGITAAHGAEATVRYARNYPVTSNHVDQTAFAAEVATDVVGKDRVSTDAPPIMGGEDFSYMLEERPGSFIFLGNGDSAGLHNPKYDFNDDVIPIGCSYWARLVEKALPA